MKKLFVMFLVISFLVSGFSGVVFAEKAEAGDIVLLSPGGTSYDAFIDFEERGNCYAKWISEL